jgi:hypothetical protein
MTTSAHPSQPRKSRSPGLTCDMRSHEDRWLRLRHSVKLYYTAPSSRSTWLDSERAWVRWNTWGRTARQHTIIIRHTVRIWESSPRYVTELIHKQRVYLLRGRMPIRWLEVSQSVKWMLTGWTNRGSILDKGIDISLHYHVYTGSGAHPALSYPVGTGGLFHRAKASGEVNQPSPSSSVLTQYVRTVFSNLIWPWNTSVVVTFVRTPLIQFLYIQLKN